VVVRHDREHGALRAQRPDVGGLVGRDGDLGRLLAAIADGRDRATGVVVTGEAGVGKTALLQAARARVEGFQVLQTTGIEVQSELPFAGLYQLLAPLLTAIGDLPGRQRAVLESAFALGPPVPHDAFAVAAGALGLLGAAAETGPLLIVVDDAQWMDAGSLDAIMFAFRRLRDQALALVIATRPHAGAPGRFGDLIEISLDPLDANTARALVIDRGSGALDGEMIDRVVALAAGIPLALVELIRAGSTPAPSPTDRSEASDQLSDRLMSRLFGRRIDGLSPPARLAALIAALDEPTEQDAFVRAAHSIDPAASPWAELESATIVSVGGGRVDFTHPLLRRAVLQSASPDAQRSAHLALASAMQERGDAERAVMHRAAGTIGNDESLALALERAAEHHRERAGHAAAARALAQSARLSPMAADRARRLLLAADDARRGGDWECAGQYIGEARRGSPDGGLRALADLIEGHIEARRGSTAAALRRYQRVADQAAATAPDLAALALTYASSACTVVGDVTGAVRAARRAREIGRGQVSDETRIAIAESLGSALALSGELAGARVLLDEVAGWYERQPQRVGAEFVAEPLMWLGEFARARRLLDDLEADARGLGAPGLLIQTLGLRADLQYRTGEWSSGLGDAKEAADLARDTGQAVLLAYPLAILSLLEGVTGHADAARDAAAQARESARRHGLRVVDESVAFALGAVELLAGNADAALVELEPTAAAVASSGRIQPAMSLWIPELIEALIAAERRADAESALDSLDAQAERTSGSWARGMVARYRGLLSEHDDFDDTFAEAMSAHEVRQMPFELARTRLWYGQRLRRAGRRVDARAQLRGALATFETLRAIDWVARAERELAGTGARLRRTQDVHRDELTPQELQIARLIAGGATNREIAANLFLSPKTIETHLTRIYRKLGLRSRSQLALWLAESGLGR
jgi:DNA-binding CsgD family transcriptional regulator